MRLWNDFASGTGEVFHIVLIGIDVWLHLFFDELWEGLSNRHGTKVLAVCVYKSVVNKQYQVNIDGKLINDELCY